MKKILFILLLLISLASQAKEQKLARITSEFDTDVTEFFVDVIDNKINSLRYVTTMENGGIFTDLSIPIERAMADGVLLAERGGHEALKLYTERFNLEKGGDIILSYLYNGVTGTRRLLKLSLIKDGNIFYLLDPQGKRINKLFLTTNYIRIVGVVGIREILYSYEK